MMPFRSMSPNGTMSIFQSSMKPDERFSGGGFRVLRRFLQMEFQTFCMTDGVCGARAVTRGFISAK
jgi:hypothetical protein